ncbi:MAG: dethiobiotin synthase [Cyclobacteriaceae bacterium]|nr:dethiobiotin synthase [Cyclobacteriaceae bacterium]MDH4295854.1 dethiobiotin synthase [Cyclobacteriaceae bacterium]MDH5249602.1 dethiobiotin synthase [Cyclobacteriaceae bacterium]
MNYFVTGIDTDSGKTLASAILCEALEADYWKPVQAGLPMDRETIRMLISNSRTTIHKETYFLNTPASPHAAAKLDGIQIKLPNFNKPDTVNNLIIEGAGGCLVPLNENNFVIDLAVQFDAEIILIADLYLGSINHTLLTFNELVRQNLKVKGIIFNGDSNPESERIILQHTNLRCLLHIKREEQMDSSTIKKYAKQLLLNWYE